MGNKPWQNASGCNDFTAYNAIKNVDAEEQKLKKEAGMVIVIIKNILELSGFELVERIQIRHKKSKKVFK